MRYLFLGALLLGCLTIASPTRGETTWLPVGTLFPRTPADPREPRISITFTPEPDHFDAVLGAPLPIVGFLAGNTPVRVVLEAGVFFHLGREDSFFPLQTMDGQFGLGLETSVGRFRGRLRLLHASAHKADGDSTVAYRGQTYSREYWSLEGGYVQGPLFLYARVGSSWHAVPEDPGLDAGLGGIWEPGSSTTRPFVAVHLDADSERSWRVNQSYLGGMVVGEDRQFRVALRYFNGNSYQGQYWNRAEQWIGIDLHFSP